MCAMSATVLGIHACYTREWYSDRNAAVARANYTLMHILSWKDIIAVMMLPNATHKWDKLANVYAAVSSYQSTVEIAKFNNFRFRDRKSVIGMLHIFGDLVNECNIQTINLTEIEISTNASEVSRISPFWLGWSPEYYIRSPDHRTCEASQWRSLRREFCSFWISLSPLLIEMMRQLCNRLPIFLIYLLRSASSWKHILYDYSWT